MTVGSDVPDSTLQQQQHVKQFCEVTLHHKIHTDSRLMQSFWMLLRSNPLKLFLTGAMITDYELAIMSSIVYHHG